MIVLIDVPDQPSNASHSRSRSANWPTAPPGFATTPDTRTGSASGPRTASAMPVTRPTQSGFFAMTTGVRRPAAIVTGTELSLLGA